MRFPILLCALLLAGSALAAQAPQLHDAPYIMAVRSDAPASDVVFAANFAASLKSETGAAFTGTTDADLSDTLSADERHGKVIVYLDGEHHASVSGDGHVADAATVYLREHGYVVEHGAVHEQAQEPTAETPPPAQEHAAPEPATQHENATPQAVHADTRVETTQPNAQVQPNENQAPPVPEPHGFFARLAAWLKHLFG